MNRYLILMCLCIIIIPFSYATPPTPSAKFITNITQTISSVDDIKMWIDNNHEYIDYILLTNYSYIYGFNDTVIFISYDNVIIKNEGGCGIFDECTDKNIYAIYIPILPNSSNIKGYVVKDDIIRYILDGCSSRYPRCVREVNHVTAQYAKLALTSDNLLYVLYDYTYPSDKYVYYYTYYPEGRPSIFKGYSADRGRRILFFNIVGIIILILIIIFIIIIRNRFRK